MDDNRLNQLMDEGWKKLNVTLETELPVKKDRKFVYVWQVLTIILFRYILQQKLKM